VRCARSYLVRRPYPTLDYSRWEQRLRFTPVWIQLPFGRGCRSVIARSSTSLHWVLTLSTFSFSRRGEGHVVTLEDLAKALSGIERPSMRLAAIGYDFTEEARAQIRSLGGFIFAEQNVWGWTEER
jgi:hypothetical protein